MLASVVGVRTPVLQATLERRLLLTYRLDPDAVADLVPGPFWLHMVGGFAVGSITLDHVTALRPRGLPAAAGFTSQNAAHRIAVEWDQHGRKAAGTFVLSRHTSARRIAVAGDRLFPGLRMRADFDVDDRGPNVSVGFRGSDGSAVDAEVVVDDDVGRSELFSAPQEGWRLAVRGAMTASLRRKAGELDWIDEHARGGRVRAASIERVTSSLFSAALGTPDSAIVARDVMIEWQAALPPR
ncbi:MAG TPA: hypothetical protein VMK16_07820 [Acidimicrobiales bacterium]|nr:hypothetical protein [Acidimicrobiales bacterium]